MGYMKRAVQREVEERAKLAARPHQVLMRFQRFPTGWQVRFTPVGSEWVLRVCTFAADEKIRSMWRRFAARRMSEDVQVFEYAIAHGSGAVELRLGEEQYAALKERKRLGLRVVATLEKPPPSRPNQRPPHQGVPDQLESGRIINGSTPRLMKSAQRAF